MTDQARNDLAPLETIPRGFGSSTADDVDYYLDRVVLPYAPRAVVIYEGDHDLQLGMSKEFILERYTSVVQRIGTAYPDARLYMIAVKPSPKFASLWPTAVQLNAMPDGTRARYVGMTICRQRPGTATGVTFYTLEDETGFVNLVVWRQVFERFSVLARTALLLGVSGKLQSESGVIHLVADELWEPELAFDPEGTSTRSFH